MIPKVIHIHRTPHPAPRTPNAAVWNAEGDIYIFDLTGYIPMTSKCTRKINYSKSTMGYPQTKEKRKRVGTEKCFCGRQMTGRGNNGKRRVMSLHDKIQPRTDNTSQTYCLEIWPPRDKHSKGKPPCVVVKKKNGEESPPPLLLSAEQLWHLLYTSWGEPWAR